MTRNSKRLSDNKFSDAETNPADEPTNDTLTSDTLTSDALTSDDSGDYNPVAICDRIPKLEQNDVDLSDPDDDAARVLGGPSLAALLRLLGANTTDGIKARLDATAPASGDFSELASQLDSYKHLAASWERMALCSERLRFALDEMLLGVYQEYDELAELHASVVDANVELVLFNAWVHQLAPEIAADANLYVEAALDTADDDDPLAFSRRLFSTDHENNEDICDSVAVPGYDAGDDISVVDEEDGDDGAMVGSNGR